MKKETLIEKVLGRLGNDAEYEESPEGLKFSLFFESFEVRDPDHGRKYRFPEGRVAVVYNPSSGGVGSPFVEESYTHPVLAEEDEAKQLIDIPDSIIRERVSGKHDLSCRVAEVLRLARHAITDCYKPVSSRRPAYFHDISEKMFEKYALE